MLRSCLVLDGGRMMRGIVALRPASGEAHVGPRGDVVGQVATAAAHLGGENRRRLVERERVIAAHVRLVLGRVGEHGTSTRMPTRTSPTRTTWACRRRRSATSPGRRRSSNGGTPERRRRAIAPTLSTRWWIDVGVEHERPWFHRSPITAGARSGPCGQ